MRSLITAVDENPEAAELLRWPGGFELWRNDHVEGVGLASGAMEGFGGDGAGCTFFFCGEGGEERPVLLADSEGGAMLVAWLDPVRDVCRSRLVKLPR